MGFINDFHWQSIDGDCSEADNGGICTTRWWDKKHKPQNVSPERVRRGEGARTKEWKLQMIFFCVVGKARKESSLNEDQKLQKITKPPTLLEYLCYIFNFHSLLAGPSCTIHEFQAFMDGSNLRPMENPNAFARVSWCYEIYQFSFEQLTFPFRLKNIAKNHLLW